ncbi:Leucine-rich glioma-inactivated protein 1, partial [Geodia barretti]
NLGQNELSYLPENVFQYTPNLYYLLLNGNNLETIGVRVFRDLQRLIQLSLYENAIFSMVEGALYGTTSLFYLQWNFDPSDISSGNSLICDCSALWLHRYIQEKGRRIETTVYCAGPPDLNGTDITALSEEHFGCGQYHNDVILCIELERSGSFWKFLEVSRFVNNIKFGKKCFTGYIHTD